jgi:SAM-dependent methyltransferase
MHIDLDGLQHEFLFWKGFVKTPRFIDGWVADIKTPELNEYVYNFIKTLLDANPGLNVLDAGSGAVSLLNGTVPKGNLTAIDPLGFLYEEIFDYNAHNITPPKTLQAERVHLGLGTGKYDVVHISNALDHTQVIEAAYENLMKCVKNGGVLIVQGFEKEATFENFSGFHQHDLFINSVAKGRNKLMVTQKHTSFILDTNPYYSDTITLPDGKRWFIWIKKKGCCE